MNTENNDQSEKKKVEEAAVEETGQVEESKELKTQAQDVSSEGRKVNRRGKVKEPRVSLANLRDEFVKQFVRTDDYPNFRPGDTVKVYSRIVEGAKERVQLFQGVILRRSRGDLPNATFTVRKTSNNVGVERTFLLHSPRVEKIELVSRGRVRRAKLYFLRDRQGKSARIKQRFLAEG